MDFKVRPFVREIDRPDAPSSRLEGQVVDGRYLLVLDGAVFPVPTVTSGEDHRGAFAVLAECVVSAHLGFELRVEVDLDEDLPQEAFGCSISIAKPHPEHAAMQAANREYNVLMTPDVSVTVYFGPAGNVNGYTSGSTNWT